MVLLVFLHLGTLLCMNAAVDAALLQLVQQHVNALKIDLDKMAFELDSERKVVKKALQDVKADLDQLEKRVSSTEQCVKHLQNEHSALTESVECLKSDVKQGFAQVEERIKSAIPQISCGNKIISVKFLCDCKKYEVTSLYLLASIAVVYVRANSNLMETEQSVIGRYSVLP